VGVTPSRCLTITRVALPVIPPVRVGGPRSPFLTTSDYAPRLRARLKVEQKLIDDATARGWPREIERHEATKRRLEQLLHDLA
jgi:hypothetical protein